MKAFRRIPETPADRSSAECIAAQWVLRSQSGLTPDETRTLSLWLAADPHHARLFEEMQSTSRLLDRLQGSAPRLAALPARPSRPTGRKFWSHLVPAGLAAAALLALAFTGWQRGGAEKSALIFATEIGGLRKIDLPDGSVVTLNTDSAIETAYGDADRRVRLTRGEAFFQVAKDPARPFWVEAGNVRVRAIGTAFNVRHYPDNVAVLVTEGKVAVNQTGFEPAPPTSAVAPGSFPSATASRHLVAGEKAVLAFSPDVRQVPPPITVAPVAPEAIGSSLAWQTGRLEFSDTPLGEVVAEFNRYNRHKLVIDDSTLATRRFGGVFARNGYDSLVEVLEQSFGVITERKDGVTLLRGAP